jgi:hypothetical protein
MKKVLYACLLLFFVTGCASFHPLGGYAVDGKLGAQDNGGSTPKMGKACMRSILGLVASGDASIQAAKANGNIKKVSTIDYEVENILGVVGHYCTVVRGE